MNIYNNNKEKIIMNLNISKQKHKQYLFICLTIEK